jgi:hypothetical protein
MPPSDEAGPVDLQDHWEALFDTPSHNDPGSFTAKGE